MSEEGGARTDRMECSSEYWVAREWDLDEEGMGSTLKVSMSRQGKRYISDDVIDRIYNVHPGKREKQKTLDYRGKERPSSEELMNVGKRGHQIND